MLKLYSDIKIVNGSSNILLLDTGREKVLILNSACKGILTKLKAGVKSIRKNEKNLIENLIKLDFIFSFNENEANFFPELNNAFETPSTITNCVIEISKVNIEMIEKLVPSFASLMCFQFCFIITDKFNFFEYKRILHLIANIDMEGFEVIFKTYNNKACNWFLTNLLNNDKLTKKILVFNDNSYYNTIKTYNEKIEQNKNTFSCSNCGQIKENNFHANLIMYSESQNYNTCLNKKLSIDTNGYIKNCINMKSNHGNILKDNLLQTIKKNKFKKYWFLKKDKIKVCKDCEYRHICTDCRAYLEDPNDIYSKPLKCGYDPYKGIWTDWRTDPKKKKAIDYYGLDMIK
ncbi:MAG: grasp-with-spasm system SPASM domain peptide maturase [Bacteroidia bacterium]